MAQPSTRLTMKTLLVLLLGLCLAEGNSHGGGAGMFPANGSLLYDPDKMDDGMMSEAYCQLLMESPVPPTADQMPWFCICSHCKGTIGPKGDRGDRGLPGMPGSPGRRGLTGFRGRPGFMGRQGIKGEKGDEGLKGDKGPVGYMGSKGERGFKGDKGDRGFEGPAGEQGFKGDEGQCPDACDAAKGPPGPSGLPGTAGPRGIPGVAGPPGYKGPKGDAGTPGQPGYLGRDGAKGEQGPEGDCNCTDGVHGKPGSQGPKGDGGAQGEQGAPGMKGMPGVKGDEGQMGVPGVPGPCAPTVQSAFSAGLTVPFPQPDQPVVFSAVFTNVLMNYNPTTGIYIAPVNGTYVFSYHLSVYRKVLKVGLFVNYVPVVITTEAAQLSTASQQVVVHLAAGDKVWIQVKDTNTNGMYASYEASSTFSGFLLNADSCYDLPLGREFNMFLPGQDMPEIKFEWSDMPGMPVPSPTPSPAP